MIPSNFLAANSRAKHIRYRKVGKILIKHKDVLLLLGKRKKNAPAAKALSSTHLDDQSLYISSAKNVLLMIRAADAFLKSDHKSAPCHANFVS